MPTRSFRRQESDAKSLFGSSLFDYAIIARSSLASAKLQLEHKRRGKNIKNKECGRREQASICIRAHFWYLGARAEGDGGGGLVVVNQKSFALSGADASSSICVALIADACQSRARQSRPTIFTMLFTLKSRSRRKVRAEDEHDGAAPTRFDNNRAPKRLSSAPCRARAGRESVHFALGRVCPLSVSWRNFGRLARGRCPPPPPPRNRI